MIWEETFWLWAHPKKLAYKFMIVAPWLYLMPAYKKF